MTTPNPIDLDELDIDLDRDEFFRSMLRELAGTLTDVVGLEEAAGFVALVGQRIGERLNAAYNDALAHPLSKPQVGQTLVDLNRRIGGDFTLDQSDEECLQFSNRTCPFGENVCGRPALCMMTSNVFGTIASENLGYARVELRETIAGGDGRCKVVVHLRPTHDAAPTSREYFGSSLERSS